MGVRLRSRDQTAKFGMARENSRPKKTLMSRSRVKIMIIVFSTAVALCTKDLYLQDRQLITSSTKIS